MVTAIIRLPAFAFSTSLKEQGDNEKKKVLQICKILGNPVAVDAILSIITDAKSISDIAMENKHPMSSTYKAIRTMESVGLVYVEKVVMDENSSKRVALYKSKVKSLSISLDKNGAKINGI